MLPAGRETLRHTRTGGQVAVMVAAALCAWARGLPVQAQDTSAVTASTSLYVRSDTDDTTVITPRVHVGAPLGESTRADVVYAVDVWTSASIDIRTAASKRVTEQRDEIDVSLSHAFDDFSVDLAYRYSTEYDYESHGGSLSGSYDFADNNANLALSLRAYFDQVGRAGDPTFDESTSTLNARASFTQVLGPATFAQLIYELSDLRGYLSSPYRFVRIASWAGEVPSTCVFLAPRMGLTFDRCLYEENPDSRLRHAIAGYLRHAFSDGISAGASYRYYMDDWDVNSHTIGIDAAIVPDRPWLLALGYRFYTQTAASHYKPFYPLKPLPEHFTSDKELTAFMSHRVSLELSREFELDDQGNMMRAVLLAAPSYYQYDDFLPLDHILALEVTLSLEVAL